MRVFGYSIRPLAGLACRGRNGEDIYFLFIMRCGGNGLNECGTVKQDERDGSRLELGSGGGQLRHVRDLFLLQQVLILAVVSAFSFAGADSSKLPKDKTKQARKVSSLDLNFPCESDVLRILGTLEAPIEWIEVSTEMSVQTGLRVFKSKTRLPNVELEFAFDATQARIQSRDDKSILQYDFRSGKSCVAEVNVYQLTVPTKKEVFGDLEMEQLLEKSRSRPERLFVIYTWSPRMNLSIQGVEEIRGLAGKMGFELIVLADPMVSDGELRTVVVSKRWHSSYGRRLTSAKLRENKALLHFPTLITLKGGELRGVTRPGYDEPMRLKTYLDSVK